MGLLDKSPCTMYSPLPIRIIKLSLNRGKIMSAGDKPDVRARPGLLNNLFIFLVILKEIRIVMKHVPNCKNLAQPSLNMSFTDRSAEKSYH